MTRGVLTTKTTKAMKSSGVAWLGDIPDGWEICRLKNVVAIYNGNSIPDSEKIKYEDPINAYPYISSKDIDATFSTANYENGMFTKKEDVLFKIAKAGSVLMCIEGGSAGRKKVLLKKDVSFVNKLACFAPMSIDGRYLFYFLLSPNFEEHFSQNLTGLIGGVSVSSLRNMPILVPNGSEQEAISVYLDEKCGAIDAAIAEAKKGIEEYKAWKKSLIFEAVNGEWKKRRLRFLADITTGNKDTQDAEPDGAYPFYVRSPIVERSTDYTFEGPGIMMAGDGAGAGRVFHYAVGKYAVHQRVYRIYNFRGIEGRFLLYSLGAIFPLEMDKGSAQSTVPSVRLPMLKDLLIPLPPLAKQLAIVDHLDEKCAAINALVAEKEALIADLEAYKKSLIYETVTGKREVA